MKKTTLALLAPLAFSAAAIAQSPQAFRAESAARQLQTTRQSQVLAPKLNNGLSMGETAPELYTGESADVGPQFLVIEKHRKTYFEAGVDAQILYTSNVLLTEKAPVDTGLLITTAYAAFAPEPFTLGNGQVAVRAGYRHQRYMYSLDDTSNQLNNLDFDVSTVFANARYAFAPNWTAFAGIEYNRLLSNDDNFNEFYTEILPGWGLERYIPINDKHSLAIAVGNAFHFTHTDPAPETSSNDRVDSILSLTWNWQITRSVLLQPYYRFQYTHYWDNGDRNDFFNTLGAAVVWSINDWASVRAFANWESRASDDQFVSDYTKIDSGVGVTLSVRF